MLKVTYKNMDFCYIKCDSLTFMKNIFGLATNFNFSVQIYLLFKFEPCFDICQCG